MSDGLDLEQFRHLAETYGAEIERWPDASRDAARITAQAPEGRAILDAERKLDGILGVWKTEPLPAKIQKSATDRAMGSSQSFIRKVRIWWAGIGIVAALSGAATGTLATAFVSQSGQSYTTTIFGDLDEGDN